MAFGFGGKKSKNIKGADMESAIQPDSASSASALSGDEESPANTGFHDARAHSNIENMLALEPRILLDAALADTAAKVVAGTASAHAVQDVVAAKVHSDVVAAL